MDKEADIPNTYDIAKELADPDGIVSAEDLFEALQEHWTEDGCCARIDEALCDGILLNGPTTHFRLGTRDGYPDPSHERTKYEQISWIKALLSEFEASERDCYCINSFIAFVGETHEVLETLDTSNPQLPH